MLLLLARCVNAVWIVSCCAFHRLGFICGCRQLSDGNFGQNFCINTIHCRHAM